LLKAIAAFTSAHSAHVPIAHLILTFGFIIGAFCALVFVAGRVAQREVGDAIDRQIKAEMHHFSNDRYLEFDRAAWALAGRDFTIQMCFGNLIHLTEAQKEHFVDQVILNDRRNKSRVGHPLQFGQY
jgi:hypothetical protein